MGDSWLADIVVVNESRDEATAGDVSVFRSAGDACGWLEHWWVENNEGFAFSAEGDRLKLGVDATGRVIVTGQENNPGGSDVVLGLLRASAAVVLEARKAKAEQGKVRLSRSEDRGHLPTSVEGLIAYIGFSI